MMKEKSGAGFPGEGNETVQCRGPKRGIDFMRWTPEGTRSGGNLQLSTRGGIIFLYLCTRAAAVAGVAKWNDCRVSAREHLKRFELQLARKECVRLDVD
jgi:hypothetical protein